MNKPQTFEEAVAQIASGAASLFDAFPVELRGSPTLAEECVKTALTVWLQTVAVQTRAAEMQDLAARMAQAESLVGGMAAMREGFHPQAPAGRSVLRGPHGPGPRPPGG